MKKAMILGLSMVVAWTIVPSATAGCDGCEKIKAEGQGFCDHCSKGMIYGVDVKSEEVYKVLAGAPIYKSAISTMKCDGCKTAALKNGVCEHCHVGVADGRIYHSIPAHTLATGKLVSQEKMTCPSCKEHAADGGFCSSCSVGFVGGRAYKSEVKFKEAQHAHEIVAKAAGAKCEHCAVALVTDGECEHCRVAFKDGKKVTS
jgi:hypothetical protein